MFYPCYMNVNTQRGNMCQAKDWLDLALEKPICKVTYVRYVADNIYVLQMTQEDIPPKGERNLEFEVVFPFYTCITQLLEQRQTDPIHLRLSSKEYPHVSCTLSFPLHQWSYEKMDELLTSLEQQLNKSTNLNNGLLLTLLRQ